MSDVRKSDFRRRDRRRRLLHLVQLNVEAWRIWRNIYIYICSLLQLNKRKDCVVMGIELNISKVCPSILSFCIVKVNKNKFFFTLREN